jgi:hypothetical protein
MQFSEVLLDELKALREPTLSADTEAPRKELISAANPHRR